ncbi:MAG: chain length determinant protein EpsF [Pseudomonadota bacterium]|jgi:succinoglycan biosynthesis transport protein ExoP
MTFEQLVAILRARWLVAAAVFTLIVGTVGAFTWLMPKTYTATASLLVDVKSPDPIAGGVPQGILAPSYLMTQIDVITSMRVAQKVVANLKLTEAASLRQKWVESTNSTGSFEGYVAQLIRSSLEARPSRGSNVINLQYQASDPEFASAVVNAFVSAYLEISMELRTDPAKQYGVFFEGSSKQMRERVQAAQDKLSTFLQRQGIVVTDERLDVETARLNELSNTYVGMQTAVADSESRRAAVKANARDTQDVMNSPLVAGLKQDLVRQEVALSQIRTRLGDSHPQTIELKTNVIDIRAKLDAEIQRVSTSVNINNSMSVSRAAQVKVSLEEQRTKVLKLKQLRDEAAMLQRDVDNARNIYDGVLARMNMTSLEAQAVQNNVVPLEYSAVPSFPSSPRMFANVALGTLVGLLLALVSVLVVERLDRRLRTTAEIDDLFHLPYAGSIPNFKKQLKSGATSEPFKLSSARA